MGRNLWISCSGGWLRLRALSVGGDRITWAGHRVRSFISKCIVRGQVSNLHKIPWPCTACKLLDCRRGAAVRPST